MQVSAAACKQRNWRSDLYFSRGRRFEPHSDHRKQPYIHTSLLIYMQTDAGLH